MGDYNDNRKPNLRWTDVLGIAIFTVFTAMVLYLLVMLVLHWFTGRVPT